MTVSAPYTDPKGMGFTATLTEVFGLPSSLDPETQRDIDERNVLAQIEKRTAEQEKQLIEINDKLNRLGFMFEDRKPLYRTSSVRGKTCGMPTARRSALSRSKRDTRQWAS